MKLSIALITWNRQCQLIEALLSCVNSEIPIDTQFVIIDNASTDNTEEAVKEFFQKYKYEFIYEKMTENLGVGRGRNYAYSKTTGDYVYFMDDDAYIDTNCRHFFKRAIDVFDRNPRIATLTTQIYDLLWKSNRITTFGPMLEDDIRHCNMICGGSHFLSRAFFKDMNPYFPNQYGYEEILPSIRVVDAGYFNAFVESLLVIHNPLVNKWDYSIKTNQNLLIKGIAIPRAMKSKYYPVITIPFVYIAYLIRSIKYLSKEQRRQARAVIKQVSKNYDFGERISLRAIFRMYKNFGFSIF